MPTIKRQIEALGGSPESAGEYNAGYHDGYTSGIEDAMEIGEQADELVDELIEWIEDILNGAQLARWANDASLMVARLKQRRAA